MTSQGEDAKPGGDFMRVMAIVKATQDSEAGVMPSPKFLADMGAFK